MLWLTEGKVLSPFVTRIREVVGRIVDFVSRDLYIPEKNKSTEITVGRAVMGSFAATAAVLAAARGYNAQPNTFLLPEAARNIYVTHNTPNGLDGNCVGLDGLALVRGLTRDEPGHTEPNIPEVHVSGQRERDVRFDPLIQYGRAKRRRDDEYAEVCLMEPVDATTTPKGVSIELVV